MSCSAGGKGNGNGSITAVARVGGNDGCAGNDCCSNVADDVTSGAADCSCNVDDDNDCGSCSGVGEVDASESSDAVSVCICDCKVSDES